MISRSVFIALFAATLFSCSDVSELPEPAVRPISWVEATPNTFRQIRRLSGTVQPVEATDLSFEVGGKIQSVLVNLGDNIKQGQVIARLDQRTYKLSLQSAEANLQQAQSTLNEARNEYNRYQELVKKELVSASGFDNVKAAFESAVSAVDIAKAQLDIAQKDLSDTDLIAPYDGTVTKRLIEPSMQVTPGQPIFEIEGTDGLEVRVMVPETIISRLNKEVDLGVSYPAFPGLISTGSITEQGSRAESANAFPVNVFILDSPPDLRAGMTAEVDFVFRGVGRSGFEGEIFRLPISSLKPGQNQTSFVFVFDPDTQTVSRRQVQTENIFDNEVLVSTGLNAGEIVAAAGVNYLRDGQRVRLLDKHVQSYN